jgi:hypothetical protein
MSCRVVIAGGPRTGKTTLASTIAAEHGLSPLSTDDLMGRFEWSALSEHVAERMSEPGPWLWEGVRAVHAMRKWLASHPQGAPADFVLWLSVPKVERTPGQVTMGKGVTKVWQEIAAELRRRGTRILTDTQGELS